MKIRLKRKPSFSLEKLLLFLSTLCVSSFALLEFTSIPIPLFTLVKWPLLYVGGICMISQINLLIRTFMKKKYFYIWLLVLLLCACLLQSGNSNIHTASNINIMRSTLRTITFLLELFILMIWVSEKGYGKFLVHFLFYYVLILVVVTDFLLFSRAIVFTDGPKEAYLVGTKFNAVYLHMDFLMLCYLKNRVDHAEKNLSVIFLVVATVCIQVVAVTVQCITGVLGSLLLVICFFLNNNPSGKGLRVLNTPVSLIGAMLICLLFPFLSELIVSIPAVKYFVVEVLGKSENLTGRMEIFEIFGKRMEGHMLFGFGMGNANYASVTLFGYATSQNALFQWILQAGFWTTVVLVLFYLAIFAQHCKGTRQKKTMPLVILLYVYVILGIVETTFSMTFFLWITLLFALTNEKMEEVPTLRTITE